jgi:hypothetical protein
LDLMCGARNGPGVVKRIACDSSLIQDVVNHFTLNHSDPRIKQMAEFGDEELKEKLTKDAASGVIGGADDRCRPSPAGVLRVRQALPD